MTEPSPQHPWLVADIGGTNARFGLVTDASRRPRGVKVLRVGDHPDLADAAETYLDHVTGQAARPEAACVAVAGPVEGDSFRLTNAAWSFSIADTGRRLGMDTFEVINDFGAQAMALPHLDDSAVRRIGPARRVPGKPMAVIGPGTGLGVAGLLPTDDGWIPATGEGGHVTLPAETPREADVMALLKAELGGVGAEYLLSGPGLARLYRYLSVLEGTGAEALRPEEICRRGQDGTDPLCAEALDMFCALLGAFAGNVALTLGARGGLLLGGGILPAMTDVLLRSDFRRRFENKSPMTPYVTAIATELITAPAPALLGATAWLARHLRHQGALTPA
ncbi:glucokinase [Streptomyces sp. NA04227]|uniref:glucokinase n=1 Tax=Streptomyces sp. NA04227 TaxID=2742136 RepID=UPI00159038D9|nr:glucokinase [Streptomyces sp. NA04227]QKW05042.1 glucokinase [Streptomyces sp. NA04227]